MTLYRIPVTIEATAYVKADKPAEALEKANAAFHKQCHELNTGTLGQSEVEVSGLAFGSDELPDVSLSPAVTSFLMPQHVSIVEEVE